MFLNIIRYRSSSPSGFLKHSSGNMDFPGGSDGKASVYNAGDPGSVPGLGRSPGEGNGYSVQYSCLKNSMDQRSLVGYRTQDMGSQSQTQLSD